MSIRSANDLPTAPFVLSLIAGLLILAGSAMMTTFPIGTRYYGMMGGYYGMMQGFGGWLYGHPAVGLISGTVILVGATMIYTRPGNVSTWGLLVLIFSMISFLWMGSFFLGAILGITGGVLALAWRPQARQAGP
ncbi:MAG: hypothetical protein JRM99_05460 [Nitrososphaerota archaeon]|nr:hypothetical protein [Nitrososphaerota archaeon]MDG6990851.1 hypothetical protein [Nitrososphaerota archaeon]